jgi:hypothetical protein
VSDNCRRYVNTQKQTPLNRCMACDAVRLLQQVTEQREALKHWIDELSQSLPAPPCVLAWPGIAAGHAHPAMPAGLQDAPLEDTTPQRLRPH